MPIFDDTQEFTPGREFREGDETTLYRITDGKVMYRHYPVSGAHAGSFRFYLGSFGKDRKNCYCTSRKLSGGNGPTFRALNYTYATDGVSVWTMGGKVKEAEAASFVVCDDGVLELAKGVRVPHGFGKDKERVFYYDYNGKPNWVRKASAATFISLNDGYFGMDADFVFCGAATLPKANAVQWRKIAGFYSRDDRRIYYFNREIREADWTSFEVMKTQKDWIQLARDRNNFYNNDRRIEEAEFMAMLAKAP